MCGIAGFWSVNSNEEESKIFLRKMAGALNHRGPDHIGYWHDPSDSIYISHTRLSIIDLSKAGNQPMISNSGRYVISFNGEIYNHKELRIKLEKNNKSIKWRGYSDTEVLLELIDIYGLKKALKKCVGMFALAIWDRKKKLLKLARDRMGEKPLYYGFCEGGENPLLVFGSELSSFKKFKSFNNEINSQALFELINYQAISAPNSIYKNIFQLQPGHLLEIEYPRSENIQSSIPWWELTSVAEGALKDPIQNVTDAEYCIENSLKEAVNLQSIADVPLGTFLSGGIDSSLITALLKNQHNNVKTFTIGFEENNFDEAPFSKSIARHLKTDHNEIYLSSKDAQNLIPKLSEIYSEPFADPSQLPTHLVCREAIKSGLKVALSGDGGDELFGGYNRYLIGENIWKKMNLVPWQARKMLGEISSTISEENLNDLLKIVGLDKFGTKISKFSDRLKYIKNSDEFFHSLISQWQDARFLFNDELKYQVINKFPSSMDINIPEKIKNNLAARMMMFDSLNYLPNDILTKVDRASMANSLETRAPFLDHRVIENSWKIGMGLKIKSNGFTKSSKWILKRILYKYVPKELLERPKAGFAIPLSDWLRDPLKSWASDLLSENSIGLSGYFNFKEIDNLWEQHKSNIKDNSSKLWPIIMFQSWIYNNKNLN